MSQHTELAQKISNVIAKHSRGMRGWLGKNKEPMGTISLPPNLIPKLEAAHKELQDTGVFPLLTYRGKSNERMMARIISISPKMGAAIAAIEEFENINFKASVQNMSGDTDFDSEDLWGKEKEVVPDKEIKDKSKEKREVPAEVDAKASKDLDELF